MKIKTKGIAISIIIFFITAIVAGTAFSGENKTIEGTVTEYNQIVTDADEAFNIAENDQAKQIMQNVGKKVKATGMVEYDEGSGANTITIENFSVLEE